jgi:cobalt-zinc-cadmium efflux system membrane fusion protein
MRVTPRFPGIVKEIRFRRGDFVKAGSVVAVIDSNESMAPYSLKAPLSGRIIERQAVPGEYVSEEESIYVLADLSTVWVNLAVYPKDADKVKPGQEIAISAVGSDASAIGSVYYVTPVIDAQTRTLTACVVLPNDDNAWRPGSFVHAHMETGEGIEGLVVNKNAVQILDNKTVVFIQHEPGSFKPVEVVTGDEDSCNVLILSGLKVGDEYVNNGAFELKAKIVTSSLGDHAGHGH